MKPMFKEGGSSWTHTTCCRKNKRSKRDKFNSGNSFLILSPLVKFMSTMAGADGSAEIRFGEGAEDTDIKEGALPMVPEALD